MLLPGGFRKSARTAIGRAGRRPTDQDAMEGSRVSI
jgi:hypothetical protein